MNQLTCYSLLSFADMAERIEGAREREEVVTFGVDDSIKAAGNNKYDLKTGHITLIDTQKSKETFTTGFKENASHCGKDAARIIQHELAKMAVLTGNTYEDMKDMVDYFMNDRSGDGDIMLDEIGVDKDKRLKCSAHVILTVEVAQDKVFKDIETVVGVSSLISEGAAHCFNAPKNSVWYLGLIALAKLFSPSHSKESISLYKDYSNFLKKEEFSTIDQLKGFKGFQSNRFGRIGEISNTMVKHKPIIDKFFESQVDEHSNKLVLAVSCYKDSAWFLLCCEVSAFFYQTVTIKMKEALYIDEFKKCKRMNGNWVDIKTSFREIQNDLEEVISINLHGGKKD